MKLEKEPDLMNFALKHLIDLYKSCGLSVIFQNTNNEAWNETLQKCDYVPVAYTNMNVEFLYQHQLGNGITIHNLSAVISWDNRRVGVWPLFISIYDGIGTVNFLDNMVLPPVLISKTPASIEKQVVKSCLKIIDKLCQATGKETWRSMESFNDSKGLSTWHAQAMGLGATCWMNHEIFIDLHPDMAAIKSQFRKSYKSLISSGQKLWNVGVLETADENIWKEFIDLHVQVSGRVTRSNITWRIHYEDIVDGHSILVYLRNTAGEMVGGGLFNFTKDEALYAVAAYDRTQFDKPLGHVVQYRAIEELKKRNVRWYKLGPRPFGSHTPAPNEKEISIGEFKHGFASHLFPRYVLYHPVLQTGN